MSYRKMTVANLLNILQNYIKAWIDCHSRLVILNYVFLTGESFAFESIIKNGHCSFKSLLQLIHPKRNSYLALVEDCDFTSIYHCRHRSFELFHF
jgi:hypothetical protein